VIRQVPGWSVGELARATGLSVRVLRHWDEIGLVCPSRTAAGHRRYGPAEVTRLYRALALRQTGLRLEQVAALLAEQDPAPAATLRAHLADLDAELRRRCELRDRFAGALVRFDQHVDARDRDDGSGGGAELLMKVIETMMMFEGYVHGYRTEENERLYDQAGTLVELLHADTGYPAGSSVLEVGCGVGAQTVALAERSPGAQITAIDVSRASLADAVQREKAAGLRGVEFGHGDVFGLPHADGPLQAGGFDHVFVCFLLEHLSRPVEALVRLRAMLKPGGTITVIEGDHGSAYFHPDSSAARDAISCQVTLQRQAGGDALIGRRLHPLLVEAGYTAVAVSPRMVYVDSSRPELVDGFTARPLPP
jgi:DNA-binding transcriptional MerR regulator/protein-L-isoaspartate O-methyltransferase